MRTNSSVEAIDTEGVLIAGTRLLTKTVIWTAGVAASPAGQWLGAEVDRAGRVKVARDLSLPGHPQVFVLGDTASVSQDGKPLPGVAPVAVQEGRYVAQVIAASGGGKKRSCHHSSIATKGTWRPWGAPLALSTWGLFDLTGFLAWMIVARCPHLVLDQFPQSFSGLFQWAWAYLTHQRGARLITCEARNGSALIA